MELIAKQKSPPQNGGLYLLWELLVWHDLGMKSLEAPLPQAGEGVG